MWMSEALALMALARMRLTILMTGASSADFSTERRSSSSAFSSTCSTPSAASSELWLCLTMSSRASWELAGL